MRIEGPGIVSDWFWWAQVSVDGISSLAEGAGLSETGRLMRCGRAFAILELAR